MNTISSEKLFEAGYTEYGQDINDYGKKTFQKKIKDKFGIKFFIACSYVFYQTFQFWDFSMQIETKKGCVEFKTVQWFNQNGTLSGRTIPEVEEYFNWLWKIHGKPYYEKKETK